MGPRHCVCGAPVIEATVSGRVILLDYAIAPKGAVAARIDPETDTWVARYLKFGDEVDDPATEVRFRQHDATCPDEPQLLLEDTCPEHHPATADNAPSTD